MTLLDYNTGEIVEYDRAAAERRAERITMRLDAIAENYSRVLPMIRDAVEKRDDIALGYRSPSEYVADRFGQSLANLGLDVRRAVVAELTEAGLSSRAIAPVVSVSDRQVRRDQVGHVSHLDQTPEPAEEGEAEAGSGQTPEGEADDAPASPVEPVTETPRPPVQGIDGKTYTRPMPRPLVAVTEEEWDEQDRAEELSRNLARNLSLLYAVTDPERRAEYVAAWTVGTRNLRPLGADFITAQHMRDLSGALDTFANEWEQAHD